MRPRKWNKPTPGRESCASRWGKLLSSSRCCGDLGVLCCAGGVQTARELGEQLLSLAQSVQDPTLLVVAHYGLGMTLFCLGEFASAREHLEQGIALYDPQQHRSSCLRSTGMIPG